MVLPFFYNSPAKILADLPKMCRSQKFGSTGSRLRGVCEVGGGFVPLKFDALESLCRYLYGQNRFHALFSSLKLVSIFVRHLPIAYTFLFCYNDIMPTDDLIIRPTSDLFIASLWSAPKNEPILRSVLNGVMTDIGQPQIVKATVLNPFNIQDYPDDKEIRLDVRVEDEIRRFYNIEVQRAWHAGFHNRSLYYWSETYESQIERGDFYNLLRPVRSIVITEFPVFPGLKQLHTVFELRSRENPKVLLTDHLQIHYLRLGDLDRQKLTGLDALSVSLRGWMQFWAFGSEWEEKQMRAVLQDVPEVQAAYGEYKRFTADPVMREKAKARERYWTDRNLDHAEAKEEGRDEKGLEVVRNMKAKGYSVAEIADISGLSLSEIERLG